MKQREVLLYILEAVIWYFFIYYWIFAIKTGTNLWLDSLVLLVLAYVGVLICPWTWQLKKHLFSKNKF